MSNKNHVLCIYHDHCADGLAAAWVVRQACKGIICELVPMSYGQELPISAIVQAGIVYIVDFSIGAQLNCLIWQKNIQKLASNGSITTRPLLRNGM